HRREKNARGEIRGRYPEDCELKMPGPRQVEGKPARQVDPKKIRELGPVVLRSPAQQRLREKQNNHDKEEPRTRALGRRQTDLSGDSKPQSLLFHAMPAEKTPPAK